MSYTNIPKPGAQSYTTVNPVGKEQYDQDIAYDSTTIFYDGTNPSQYTNVTKPSTTTYTKVSKPT